MNKNALSEFLKSLARSYSQVFFSENYWFAIPLIVVSFIDFSAGFSGLLAALSANIAAKLLDKLAVRVETELGAKLAWDDAVLDRLAEEGYDPAFGARPLKRLLVRAVETPLSRLVLEGKVEQGKTILLSAAGDSISMSAKD